MSQTSRRVLQHFLRFSALTLLAMMFSAEASAQLIINEFRLRGPSGANDEFIEIYNNSGADFTVVAVSGTGFGIAASDGTTRCTIPNGTIIPNGGCYLCVNSVAYSLAAYPAGNGTTATGDATYTTDIPDNAGVALFNNNTGGASYSLANRLDAVGSTSEANTLYKEGTGYAALTPFSIDYAFVRDACGKGGSISDSGPCTQAGAPKDTNNNAADFVFVDTNGTSAGAGQRLGAPGPQNLSAPLSNTSSIPSVRLDTCVSESNAPNFVRDFTSDPPNNSTFGTVDIRRTFTNNTGGNLTRLRFRIVDLTTFPAPSGIADLRPRTSTSVVVTVDRAPCGTGMSNITVQGTTLEQLPAQPNGGGFNSSLGAGTVTLGTPLPNGSSIDLRFLFGIQQTGNFRVALVVEGLPFGGGTSDMIFLNCNTETGCAPIVTSIVRANPNPTTAASVDFTVNFGQPVTGVDATDFVLTTAGAVTGASITGVAGSGATYTVTVNTGTGDGTIRLDVVDNDTIIAGAANPLGGTGAGNGNFSTGELYTISRTSPQLIISEFRLRGPNGANDEFIEIYNNSAVTHAVAGVSGTGYAVAASDGVIRCTIPNGTIFGPRGHFLCVNSGGYSLAGYAAGSGTTATGNVTYAADIPDNAGIALFNNNTGGGSFTLANRLDAVGSTSEANTLYKEGTGYAALTPFSIDYAFVRDACGKGGSIADMGPCTQAGLPKDTNNNAVDFVFVDTNGTSAGAGQRLGTPGPENLSSPVSNTGSISNLRLDPCAGDFSPPNFVRDHTSDPINNSTFGTVDIRRTFTNNTGGNLTRLRFRIVDLTTFPAPAGIADLRPRTSTDVVVTVDRAPCGSGTSNVTVHGTTLDQPPTQSNGGGFNSSLGAGTVTLGTPLANGASIDLRFLFGVQQTGNFRVGIVVEGLPLGGGAADFLFLNCNTETGCAPVVSSIVRANPDPTAAASVDFTVTFNQPVTGVDAADFVLTTTGTIAGASVTGVTGSGATYTVSVNTGTGNGTIRLDLIDNDTIVDGGSNPLGGAGAGNGNFTTGQVYSIVRPPQVTATKTAAFLSGSSDIRYTISLTNTGGDATGVTFNDTPDGNTTLNAGSVTTTQGTILTGNGPGDISIQINVGTLISGVTVTVSYVVHVNPGVAIGTVLLNQGTVSGGNFANVVTDDPGNSNGSNDSTGITTQAVAIPALDFAGLLALVLLLAAAGAVFLSRRT